MLVRLNTNFPEPVDPRIEILVTCFPTYVISAWPYPQAFHANEVGGELHFSGSSSALSKSTWRVSQLSVKSICLSFQAPPDAGFVPPDASGCDATSYGSLAVLIQVDPAPDCQLEFFRIHPVEFMIRELNSLYFKSHAKMALENKTCLRKYGAYHLFFRATFSVGARWGWWRGD